MINKANNNVYKKNDQIDDKTLMEGVAELWWERQLKNTADWFFSLPFKAFTEDNMEKPPLKYNVSNKRDVDPTQKMNDKLEKIIENLKEQNRLLTLIMESLRRNEKPPVYIVPADLVDAVSKKQLPTILRTEDDPDFPISSTIPPWDVHKQ